MNEKWSLTSIKFVQKRKLEVFSFTLKFCQNRFEKFVEMNKLHFNSTLDKDDNRPSEILLVSNLGLLFLLKMFDKNRYTNVTIKMFVEFTFRKTLSDFFHRWAILHKHTH